MFLPVRTCLTFMPRVSLPEHSRKRDAVAMVRVHVGLDLEHEGATCAALPPRPCACRNSARAAPAQHLPRRFKQVATPKLRSAEPKIDRRQMAFAERRELETACRPRSTSANSSSTSPTHRDWDSARRDRQCSISRKVAPVLPPHRPRAAARRRFRRLVGAGEVTALRPIGQVIGVGVQRQRLLDLVEEFERVAALAVHLVDEGDDRDVAQPADLEQLAGARSRCPWRRRSPSPRNRPRSACGRCPPRSPRGPACPAG
jgi:hypothetical protein